MRTQKYVILATIQMSSEWNKIAKNCVMVTKHAESKFVREKKNLYNHIHTSNN